MPSFCFPCWPKDTVSHFGDNELSVVTREAELAPHNDGFGKPTTGEYAGEAAKDFLKVLQGVAEVIPVPGVRAAVKTALVLIQACDESHATLERAEELKLRIKALVTILVNELKGKKAEEVEEKLKEDIRSLENDLKYIQRKLDEIASQHALLVIFFRSFNEDRVRKCVGRLDNALESFNLARQLNDANLLSRMEQQITTFHASHQKSLNQLQVTMDDVKDILEKRLPKTSSSSQPRSRSVIPANTDIFYGRDALVADLVVTLTSVSDGPKRPHRSLVMAHPDMKKHFPDRNQVWVPCVKATSVSLFLDTLYSSLKTSQNTGNTYHDIISELKSSPDPLIILLDNFETPWNVDGGRSEIERILRDLDHIVHITLFVTMRSSIAPMGVHWHSVDLKAVDEDAAQRIYTDIYSDGSQDENLPELLQVVGHMPLAVTLMARVGRMTGLGAESLVEEYKRTGTVMLSQGTDAEHSMDICISLSVDSPYMKKHPEAFELLATLAMLPVGTTYDLLVKRWASGLPNVMGALQILGEVSLVERREANFFVLPVIRSYILHPSRFSDKVRASMVNSACNFLMQHNSSPGDPSYTNHSTALSAEEGNLQAILLETTAPELDIVEALLVLARHQLLTRPRLEIIEHTLNLARRMPERNQALMGDVLGCYGGILQHLDRYDDALEQHNLARQAFLSISDTKRAAHCLINIILIYIDTDPQFERDSTLVEEAKSAFEKLDDTGGVALSLLYLGHIHGLVGFHEEGIELLTRVRAMFQDLGDSLHHSQCLYHLSRVYRRSKNYESALTLGMSAVQEYEHLGQYTGDVLHGIGRALFYMDDYPAALTTFVQCLNTCKSFGRPWHIGQTLEHIGRAWGKMDQKADARSAYAEAIRYYGMVQGTAREHGITCCRFFIRALEDPLLVPSDDEKQVLAKCHVDFQ